MLEPISTLLLATGGAFLGKLVEPAAESLGKKTWEYLSTGATALLTAVEREPHPVELKVLTPLVQAAALEHNPSLAKVWAAMLANAADPAQRVQVRVSFIETLRQLTLNDVIVLDTIAKASSQDSSDGQANTFAEAESIKNAIDGGISGEEFAITVDVLVQLRLCQVSALLPSKPDSRVTTIADSRQLSNPTKYIGLTSLGWAFLKACTPPAA